MTATRSTSTVRGALSGGQLRVTGQYRVVLPDGRPLPAEAQAIGRGADLRFLTGDEWYHLDLEHVTTPG